MDDDEVPVSEADQGVALPREVIEVFDRPPGELLVVVATTDADGAPRTAVFGTMRAVSAERLRFGCRPTHATYANLCRDGRVMIAVHAAPDVAVGIAGTARVLTPQLESWPSNALIEVEVTGWKDDRVAGLPITRGMGYEPDPEAAAGIAAVNRELLDAQPEDQGPV